jgi:hypothetical protein
MDAMAVLDPGPLLGRGEDLFRGVGRQGTAGVPPREQPSLRSIEAPVGTEFLQQSRGEQGVAVLAALALIDPDQHPIRVDVARVQMDQFRDPQPGAIGRHQQHAVLGVPRGVEELGDLAAAERFRQPPAALRRNTQGKTLLPQHVAVEKLDAGQFLIAGAEGRFLLGDQVMEEVADLLDRDRVWGTSIVLGQLGHRGDVRLDREGGLAVQFEFADHLVTQGSHVSSSLGKRVETEIHDANLHFALPLRLTRPLRTKKARPSQAELPSLTCSTACRGAA